MDADVALDARVDAEATAREEADALLLPRDRLDGIDLGDGYDVVLVLGQSNAAGHPTDWDQRTDPPHPRVWQYGAAGTYVGKISQAVEPLAHPLTPPGLGIGLGFGRWYAEWVAPCRRVLLVPVAVGGSGFTAGGTADYWWLPGHAPASTNLYEQAITAAGAALAAAGPDARLAAILWHQGEADQSGGGSAAYAANLDTLISGLRTRLSAPDVPFIVGQLVPERIAANQYGPVINAVHVDTPRRHTRAGFAYGISNSHEGDSLHYNAAGQHFLHRSMFDAFLLARANVPGEPLPPGAITGVQSGTTLAVSWVRPLCRVTDYEVQYRLVGAGSWTTPSRTTPNLDSSQTITGLTKGSSYEVRIRTANEQGTSPWTTQTLAMLSDPAAMGTITAGTATQTTQPLSWAAVARASSYLVEYRTSAGPGSWTTSGTVTGTSATVSGLAAGTSYDYRVTPQNAAGSGAAGTVTATTAAPSTLIDAVGVAAWRAYGLRKLRAAHSGSAIRVRRSSDNAERDIGFTGVGLDTTDLLSWAGSDSVYVKTLYDQSGNSRDITQSTAASQPRTVNAGVLDTKNGLPTMVFDGVDDHFRDTSPGAYAAGASTFLAVVQGASGTPYIWAEGNSSVGTSGQQYSFRGSNSLAARLFSDSSSILLNQGSGTVASLATQLSQASGVDSGSNYAWFIDSITKSSGAYTRGTTTLNTFAIGILAQSSVSGPWNGQISELVIWGSALTTGQRQAGENNQKAYYATA